MCKWLNQAPNVLMTWLSGAQSHSEVEVKREISVVPKEDDPACSVSLMTELSRIFSSCSTFPLRKQLSRSVSKYLSVVPQFPIDLLDTMVLFSVPLEFNLKDLLFSWEKRGAVYRNPLHATAGDHGGCKSGRVEHAQRSSRTTFLHTNIIHV